MAHFYSSKDTNTAEKLAVLTHGLNKQRDNDLLGKIACQIWNVFAYQSIC